MKRLVKSLFYFSVFIGLYSTIGWLCFLPVVFILIGKGCYEWRDIQKYSGVENTTNSDDSLDNEWIDWGHLGINNSLFDDDLQDDESWRRRLYEDDYW